MTYYILRRTANWQVDKAATGTYSTDLIREAALRVIGNHSNQTRGMFLYLPFQAVHAPLQAKPGWQRKFPRGAFPKGKRGENRWIYAAMVLEMDASVGAIVDALKPTGQYNDSILLVSSDNGGLPANGGYNWPYRGHKAGLWEGGLKGIGFLHSPLLAGSAGRVYTGLVHVSGKLTSNPVSWFSGAFLTADCGGRRLAAYVCEPRRWKCQRNRRSGWHRCLGCHRHWRPIPTDGVAAQYRHVWQHCARRVWERGDSSRGPEAPVCAAGPGGLRLVGTQATHHFAHVFRAIYNPYLNVSTIHLPVVSTSYLNAVVPRSRYIPPGCSKSVCVPPPTPVGVSCLAEAQNTAKLWLFNLTSDPYERCNLANDTMYAAAVSSMLGKLAEYNATAVPCNYPKDDPRATPRTEAESWGPWRGPD